MAHGLLSFFYVHIFLLILMSLSLLYPVAFLLSFIVLYCIVLYCIVLLHYYAK